MEPPSVTVVIPAYKAEKTIQRTVESVYNQIGVEFFVIVVEDGVFDRTQEILDPFKNLFNFRLLSYKDNKGGQFARNFGLEHVVTNYVMFLDSDDYIEGEFLAGAVNALEDYAGDLCFNQWKDKSSLYESMIIPPPSGYSSFDILKFWIVDGYFIPPVGLVWKTNFIRHIGGWHPDLKKNQDGELVHRALLQNPKLVSNFNGCGVYWHDSDRSERVSMSAGKVRLDSMKETYCSLAPLFENNKLDDLLATQCYKNSRSSAIDGFQSDVFFWSNLARKHGRPLLKNYKYHSVLDRLLGITLKENIICILKNIVYRNKYSKDFSPRYIPPVKF